jgi:hypothetical protein
MFLKVIERDGRAEARVNVLHITSMQDVGGGQVRLTFWGGTVMYITNTIQDLEGQLERTFAQ